MENVKEGARFIVIKDYPTHALTSWGKPYSGSEEGVILRGTVMIAFSDQIDGALGFGVVPERYKEMESQFISSKTLSDSDYSNYHFVFKNEDYGRYFIYEDSSKNDPSKYTIGDSVLVKNILDVKNDEIFKSIKNPTQEDIENAVRLFNNAQRYVPGYIILTKANIVNNITVYSKEEGFYLESQEEVERYKSTRFFNANEIIKILISYADGTSEWKETVTH